MRTSGSFFVLALFLASCANYQYVSLESQVPRNGHHQFVLENDTFKISFQFWGKRGPVRIEVFNKFSGPLYVDWKKSALVRNQYPNAMWKDYARIAMRSGSYSFTRRSMSTVSAGIISRPEQISFLPPQSYTSIHRYSLQNKLLKAKDSTGVTQPVIKKKQYVFQKENTPLAFRVYITLSTTEDFRQPITIDKQFWVSNTVLSNVGPTENRRSDRFYIKDYREMWRNIGCAAALALLSFVVTR